MGPIDAFFHVSSFMAPAWAVGVLVALAARVVLRTAPQGGSWWRDAAINSIAGLLGLAAGLWYFGVDGKMAAYAGLVLAAATSQWFCSRGWKG